MRGIARPLALVVLLAGCGGDDRPTPDAATDAATPPGDSGFGLPPLPSLTPCPPGWRETGGGAEPVLCEPWPASGRADCASDEAHFPGEDGCTRIGAACPSGDFPTDLPTDRPLLYVLEGATSGDGSIGAPFGTIGAALAASSSGVTVALSRGTFSGAVDVPGGVSVLGACVAGTRLEHGALGENEELVTMAEGGASLENLFVDAGPTDAVNIYHYGGSVRVADVVMEGDGADGPRSVGVFANGDESETIIENFVARRLYWAVNIVFGGGSLDLRRVSVEASMWGIDGVTYTRGTSVHVADSVITGGLASSLFFDLDPGTAQVERVVIEDGGSVGIGHVNGGNLQASDVVIRRIGSDPDGVDGFGLYSEFAGRLGDADPSTALQRIWIEDVRDAGLLSVFWSWIDAEDVVIRGVNEESCCPGGGAAGVAADAEARLTASGFLIEGVSGCGIDIGAEDEIDVATGSVRGSAIGACVRQEDYDLSRIMDGVLYLDNGLNLDAPSLPVPGVDAVRSMP